MVGIRLRKILPNLFTLGNLLCGFLAIINVVEGTKANLVHAAWWIVIAGVFDLLDGKVARLMRSASPFGVELDSLADIVSFGVAPAVLINSFVFLNAGNLGYFLCFCFLSAGAIRLARFNTTATTVKKRHFTGMPIPAGACIISSYVMFSENVWTGLANFDIAIALVIFSSLAMVSKFKYAAFPLISFAGKLKTVKSLLTISVLLLIVAFPNELFFPAGILYLLSGPVGFISVPAFNYVFRKEL